MEKVKLMDSDDELEEIRRRKMQELQRSAGDEQAVEEQRRRAEMEKARKQQILRQILTPEARERLSRVRLVKPELADNVENQLIQLAGMGRVNRMIGDEEVREILDKLTATKRESKIEWRKLLFYRVRQSWQEDPSESLKISGQGRSLLHQAL